jgi:transposase
MRNIIFTAEEIEKLRYERFNQDHSRVQMKIESLLLKSQGLEHKKIGEIMGICQDTLREYFNQYIGKGLEGLKELRFYKPKSKLENYHEIIDKEFRENPPATIKEASSRIKELTGIERSLVQVGKFLKKNRIKTIKSSTYSCEGGS